MTASTRLLYIIIFGRSIITQTDNNGESRIYLIVQLVNHCRLPWT
jgi:hypothetical protein